MLLVAVALSAVRTLTLDIISHGSLRQFLLRRAAFFGALDEYPPSLPRGGTFKGGVGWGRRRWRPRGGLHGLLSGQGSAAFGGASRPSKTWPRQGSTALRGPELRRVGLVAPFSDVLMLAQFSPGNLDIISTSSSSGWRQLRRLLEECPAFFYVIVDTDLEVDYLFALKISALVRRAWCLAVPWPSSWTVHEGFFRRFFSVFLVKVDSDPFAL